MLKAWIFLMLAIVCEVFGVSVMNYSQEGNQIFVYGFMFAMIGVAYYFMSLSIRTISVGVAYAIWEIVGLSLITLIAIYRLGTCYCRHCACEFGRETRGRKGGGKCLISIFFMSF